MIAEPIKAKRNVEFVCNLLYVMEKQQRDLPTDKLKSVKSNISKECMLTKIEHPQQITKEIIDELSTIPNQLEYLIEDALPYDAYTLIEELEKGKVNIVLQVLLLCIIHARNMSIIYESGLSKEPREYSCSTEDSFDSNSPLGDKEKEPRHNYYAFVYLNGECEVFSAQQGSKVQNVPPPKAHSFQYPTTLPAGFPHSSPISMTFDASLNTSKRIRLSFLSKI